jgi:hypothetical protein
MHCWDGWDAHQGKGRVNSVKLLIVSATAAIVGEPYLQPADRFGSPSSEDLDTFVREFNAAFEEALGEELASDIAVEVSSPVSAQAGCCDIGSDSSNCS